MIRLVLFLTLKVSLVQSFVTPTSILLVNEYHPVTPQPTYSQSFPVRTHPPSLSSTAVNSAAIWVTSSIVGGTLGAPFVTRATSSWYRKIHLPSWTPPDRIFAPVWTTLYAFMGYSAYRVSNMTRSGIRHPVILLALFHYGLNIAWAPLFFGAKKLRAGHFLNIAILWTLIATTMLFWRIDMVSGILLLPYLAWVIFATKLSSTICKLNPTKQGYNNAMFEADLLRLQKDAGLRIGL